VTAALAKAGGGRRASGHTDVGVGTGGGDGNNASRRQGDWRNGGRSAAAARDRGRRRRLSSRLASCVSRGALSQNQPRLSIF
jgi:hypothetical protein